MTTATATRPAKTAKPRTEKPDARLQVAVNLFHLAGDATRLKVVLMLAEAGELHVGAICDRLSMSQPAVSHHLCLARMGRIIECRRSGKFNHYSLTDTGRELARTAKGLMGA